VPTVTSVKGATSTAHSLTAGGLKRFYEVIAPDKGLPKSAPVIVMLSGLGASLASEIGRDRLVDYASAGKAEVVYPVGYGESWNVDGCCGQAGAKKVNDLAFMRALVPAVDPGHARPVYVVGYSNGDRLAYQVACDDPGLFDGYALVKGGPTTSCALSKAVNIVVMASLNDPEVPYKPGAKGSTGERPVLTVVSRLRAEEKCPAKSTLTHSGSMTQTAWTACADGARLALATWSGGAHSFPRPPGSVPAASQVAWAFFTNTPLAPLPD
jgi:polyhydroxybutyrate depolymerase